jgi:N-methylhydantoinase B
MPGKVTRIIKKGDVFRYEQAGAGGWGDPLERETERVLSDVRNEYISLATAREKYGVVIDKAGHAIDQPATDELRANLRARRGRASSSIVDRGKLPIGAVERLPAT